MTNKGGEHLILVGTLTVDVEMAMRYAKKGDQQKRENQREAHQAKGCILLRQHGKQCRQYS